jgi:hypothetical protein
LFIILLSNNYQTIFAVSPVFFRETINEPQADVRDVISRSIEKNSPTIDFKKIIYSSNGKELNITLLFDEFYDKSCKSLNCIYRISVPFNLDPTSDKSVDYVYTFLFSTNVNKTNVYIGSNDTSNAFFRFGEWKHFQSEVIDEISINKIEKTLDFNNAKPQPRELYIGEHFITLALDLSKVGFPDKYTFSIDTFLRNMSNLYDDDSNDINVPTPEPILESSIIDVLPGTTKVIYLDINETNKYDLNTTISLPNSIDDLKVKLESNRTNTLLNGYGSIPIIVTIPQVPELKNYIIPVTIHYAVAIISLLELPDLVSKYSISSSALPQHEYTYTKTFFLTVNVLQPTPLSSLINFNEIPKEYIAIFVGAISSFFIPSAARFIHSLLQNYNAGVHFKKIKKSLNNKNSNNLKLNQIKEKIMEDYIKGRINNDQYQILNETVSEYLSQFNKDTDDSKS